MYRVMIVQDTQEGREATIETTESQEEALRLAGQVDPDSYSDLHTWIADEAPECYVVVLDGNDVDIYDDHV